MHGKCARVDGPKVANELTIEEALVKTLAKSKITRNRRIELKSHLMTWEKMRAISVTSYFQLRLEGMGKMKASAESTIGIYQGGGIYSTVLINNKLTLHVYACTKDIHLFFLLRYTKLQS